MILEYLGQCYEQVGLKQWGGGGGGVRLNVMNAQERQFPKSVGSEKVPHMQIQYKSLR